MMYWKVETFFRQNLQEAISCYQFVIYPKGKIYPLRELFLNDMSGIIERANGFDSK